jgi:hypothetical protein
VLSAPGGKAATRVAASLLVAHAATATLARSAADLRRVAARLLAAPGAARRLRRLRGALARRRVASPVFDSGRWARRFAAAMRALWESAAANAANAANAVAAEAGGALFAVAFTAGVGKCGAFARDTDRQHDLQETRADSSKGEPGLRAAGLHKRPTNGPGSLTAVTPPGPRTRRAAGTAGEATAAGAGAPSDPPPGRAGGHVVVAVGAGGRPPGGWESVSVAPPGA